MKKVMVIGASGLIGRAVADLLEPEHEVVRVGHSKGSHTVGLGSVKSIEALFKKVGTCDAVICAAGLSRFAKLTEAKEDDFIFSLNHKLNAVSPILVTETAQNMGLPLAGSMTAKETAKAYTVTLGGDMTGQVLDVRDYGIVKS